MSIIVTDYTLKAQTEWLLLQWIHHLCPYDKVLFAKKEQKKLFQQGADQFLAEGCMTKTLLLESIAGLKISL